MCVPGLWLLDVVVGSLAFWSMLRSTNKETKFGYLLCKEKGCYVTKRFKVLTGSIN